MMAGDDDDPCRGGIEILIEVGRQSLHIRREALECRTARTVAVDRLVQTMPQLLPRRATRGAVLLTWCAPLGSLWLRWLETARRGAFRPPVEADSQIRRLGRRRQRRQARQRRLEIHCQRGIVLQFPNLLDWVSRHRCSFRWALAPT